MKFSERSTRLVHLVSRVAVRLASPLQAKSVSDALAAMLPPLRGAAEAEIAMKGLGDSGTCLTRALAVASRLPGAEIVIGVDPSRRPISSAHAWVEFKGRKIETVPIGTAGPARVDAREHWAGEGPCSLAEIARLSATRHRPSQPSAQSFDAALRHLTELFRRFR
jgi:hypothetical protein